MGKKSKARNKTPDKTFSAPTESEVVSEFQKLLQDKHGHFPWAQMLDHKEMKFVYDMVAWAEAKKDFQPTSAQARWGVEILKKIDAAKKQWRATHGQRTKMPSTRVDMVARKNAKERLKKAGIFLSKSTPSDLELAEALHSIGAIDTAPSKATAKDLLLSWNRK